MSAVLNDNSLIEGVSNYGMDTEYNESYTLYRIQSDQ